MMMTSMEEMVMVLDDFNLENNLIPYHHFCDRFLGRRAMICKLHSMTMDKIVLISCNKKKRHRKFRTPENKETVVHISSSISVEHFLRSLIMRLCQEKTYRHSTAIDTHWHHLSEFGLHPLAKPRQQFVDALYHSIQFEVILFSPTSQKGRSLYYIL